MRQRRFVRRFRTGAAMADFAAGLFRKALLGKPGKFTAALSGGKTPARLLKKLSGLPLPWARAVFFMADERLVPASSPESNFGAASARFFSKIEIPRRNLHPVKRGPDAARAYGRELLKETGGTGRLDFIFLGLGTDGHTASIFPGGGEPERGEGPVCAALAPRDVKTRRRVTLSLKTINSSACVVLMAAGPGKKEIFRKALLRDKKIPAGLLNPRGELHLLYSERE